MNEIARCPDCGIHTIELVSGVDYAPDELRCNRDYLLMEILLTEESGEISTEKAMRLRKLVDGRV